METTTKVHYYIKQGNKRLGAFNIEGLQQQALTPNTLIWFEGQKGWKKLKDIPELTPVYNSLPPASRNKTVTLIWAGCIILLLGLIVEAYYLFVYLPAKKRELKPLTTEELYNKYSQSVALIKHAFLYKMHIGNTDWYFKDYNPQTGQTDDLTNNYDSIKQHPIITWGSGFFINNEGQLLTCNHVIDIMPSQDEQIKILNYLKGKALIKLENLQNIKERLKSNIESVSYRIANYGNMMSPFEYAKEMATRNNMLEKATELEAEINETANVANLIFDDKNFVSKTSLQFGIFLNGTASNSLNDYIKCDVVKRPKSDDVDLALIQTKNKTLPHKNIVPINLDRVMQSDTMTVRLTEPVRMIGFNYGIDMANTSNGIKSQITEGAVSQNSDVNKILYTIPALSGSSGSPVFDQYGRLLSVNFAGIRNSQSFNYGVHPKKIKEFLGK